MMNERNEAMYRRKVVMTATAIFAFGVAFAAQPISLETDRQGSDAQRHAPWAPGTDLLMSAHETSARSLAPPR